MKTLLICLLCLVSYPLIAQEAGAKSAPNGISSIYNPTPIEELSQEHGLLRRIFAIYEEMIRRMDDGQGVNSSILQNTTNIVIYFIENYHEKLEEEFIYPFFIKAHKMVDMIQTLQNQHAIGRSITASILTLAQNPNLETNIAAQQQLKTALRSFIRLYRPHAAREDSVVFPAFKTLISADEYEAIGQIFAQRRKELFGPDGYQKFFDQVDIIERALNISDLSKFNTLT